MIQCAEKRDERREVIQRPRKSITFDLLQNKVRPFNKEEAVMDAGTKPIRSALRNRPATTSRLVGFDVLRAKSEQPAQPAEAVGEPCVSGSESDCLETQSGDVALDDDTDIKEESTEVTLSEEMSAAATTQRAAAEVNSDDGVLLASPGKGEVKSEAALEESKVPDDDHIDRQPMRFISDSGALPTDSIDLTKLRQQHRQGPGDEEGAEVDTDLSANEHEESKSAVKEGPETNQ